jgi:N-acetylglucosamine-6-phosphate deacetylase
MIVLTASRLYTPLEQIEQPLVFVEGERIAEVSSRAARSVPSADRLVDFGDGILTPGLVDMHIHGGAGHDVMEADSAAQSAMEQFLAKHGVTSYLPTTVTASLDRILSALEHLATIIERAEANGSSEVRAQPLGIHLEGPFISHIRRGVHPLKHLLSPSLQIFERFWQAARGHIRVMTIAPELEGAKEVIAEAARRGICVSLGHTNADLNTARAAVALGARHATHGFNAMRPLDHREPGIIGEMLTDSRITADIIADGVHLNPAIVELFLKSKGPKAAVLITDAISATGMPDGHYRLGSLEVEVKDGKCVSDGRLAGSVLTLDRAMRNAMEFSKWGLREIVRTTTLNPANVAGLADRGRLEAGAKADMLVLSASGDVRSTITHGKVAELVGTI